MSQNKDILWKGLLEWIFDDLLRFKFRDADRVFDLDKQFVFMDKELAALVPGSENEMTNRIVDKLAKVQLKKKRPALVHVEVQGETKKENRRLFGARMFQYFNLVFAKYNRPIASIAIYTGADGHLFPKNYAYSLLNTRIKYEYDTINIWDYTDGALFESDNPFAWAIVVAKLARLRAENREQRWLEMKLVILQKLFDKGLFENRKLQAVLVFMEHYLPFEDPKIIATFKERADRITGKKNTMDIFEQVKQMAREEGLEEGRKVGLVEGQQEGLREGLREGIQKGLQKGIQKGLQKGEQAAKERFIRQLVNDTEFSDDKIAALVGCTREHVAAVRKQMSSK